MSCIMLCRTCLSFSTKLRDIRNTQLQDTFEKLTCRKLSQSRGTCICYICYAQLQRCRKFADMAWKSEVVLSELTAKGVKITQAVVNKIGRVSQYLVTPVDYSYNGLRDAPGHVKKENVEIVEKDGQNFNTEQSYSTDFQVLKQKLISEMAQSDIPNAQNYPSPSEIVNKIQNFTTEHKLINEIGQNDIPIHDAQDYPSTSQIIKEEYVEMEIEFQNDDIVGNEVIVKEEPIELEDTWLEDGTIPVEADFNCNAVRSEDVLQYAQYNFDCNVKMFEHRTVPKKPITQDFTCDICTRTFKTKRQIQDHITAHMENKLYSCRLCDKGYLKKEYLKEHIKVHSREKLYNCHLCGYLFTDRSTLRRHLKVHDSKENVDVKTFDCNICSKKFLRNCHLNTHMRVHTGNRPFQCKICEHSFSQKCSLVGHMRIHTGEKTHYCSKCNKGFYRKGHLIQHMVVHTKDSPFKCTYCGKRYTAKINLIQHACKLRIGK